MDWWGPCMPCRYMRQVMEGPPRRRLEAAAHDVVVGVLAQHLDVSGMKISIQRLYAPVGGALGSQGKLAHFPVVTKGRPIVSIMHAMTHKEAAGAFCKAGSPCETECQAWSAPAGVMLQEIQGRPRRCLSHVSVLSCALTIVVQWMGYKEHVYQAASSEASGQMEGQACKPACQPGQLQQSPSPS